MKALAFALVMWLTLCVSAPLCLHLVIEAKRDEKRAEQLDRLIDATNSYHVFPGRGKAVLGLGEKKGLFRHE